MVGVVEERDDTALRRAASLPCDQARPDRFGCFIADVL